MNRMEEVFNTSVIKGILFSAYDKFGPQPIYKFPEELNDENYEQLKDQQYKFTLRDYIQISIKNLSLLVGDLAFSDDEKVHALKTFGILPYPDYNLTSLTYFHFIKIKNHPRPIASSFSILVDEKKRSFLYNNINRIKPLVSEFFERFDQEVREGYKTLDVIEPLFYDFLKLLVDIEEHPSTPITSQRKMKILFAGLDNSGKTSFLLSVDRKYSKLIGLKPTMGVEVKSIEALGATIFLWDLGGQVQFRDKYLSKSQIYLYEADLLFYFIDVRNRDRFEESFEYLKKILKILSGFEQKTSLIFILSKVDPDITDDEDLKENIKHVRSTLNEILGQNPETYSTSIFSIFSILRAFSSGISKLSINKDLINQNLRAFSTQLGIHLSLLLSTDGLVLADYYSSEAKALTELTADDVHEDDLVRNIFEVTAPQFAALYKIFSKFKTLQKEEATFKVANSLILFLKTRVSDYDLFILFLIDEENKKDEIKKQLPDFLAKAGDLLTRYIS